MDGGKLSKDGREFIAKKTSKVLPIVGGKMKREECISSNEKLDESCENWKEFS